MLSDHNRRPEFEAGNHFSFSSATSEQLDYGKWAESLKSLDNFFSTRSPHRKFGPWARTIRLPNSSSTGEGSSDASSPPLWKSSSPEFRHNVSRAQMIAKYRQEMMDLIRDLPETAYELSLRDIVESTASPMKENDVDEKEAALTERWEVRAGRGSMRVRNSSRNCSLNSGTGRFLLKLFMPTIPAVLGGGRKISPRPMAAAADGEWSCGYRESSSNGSSDSSSSSRGRQVWKLGACYPFFCRPTRSRSR